MKVVPSQCEVNGGDFALSRMSMLFRNHLLVLCFRGLTTWYGLRIKSQAKSRQMSNGSVHQLTNLPDSVCVGWCKMVGEANMVVNELHALMRNVLGELE